MKKIFKAFKAFFDVLVSKNECQQITQKEPSKETQALTLLCLLQKRGRLIDFLMEDIKGYKDEQIGSAVRQVHAECSDFIKEAFAIKPIFDQPEGSAISLPVGSDMNQVQLSGEAKGVLPLRGILRHKGWSATKLILPQTLSEQWVLAPAEVEV